MDEIENDALSLVLLLDDKLFPLFLEWTVAQRGCTAMVLFLLEADLLRFKNDAHFLLATHDTRMASIDRQLRSMHRAITDTHRDTQTLSHTHSRSHSRTHTPQRENSGSSSDKSSSEDSDLLPVRAFLSQSLLDAYTRLLSSGVPLCAAYAPLTERVWAALLRRGKSVVRASQWSSIRRSLLKQESGIVSVCDDDTHEDRASHNAHTHAEREGDRNDGNDEGDREREREKESLFVSLTDVLCEPTYCKYFERFLQREPAELSSLHCYKSVSHILAQVQRLHVRGEQTKSSFSLTHTKAKSTADSARPVQKYSDLYEAFRLLLRGTRSLQKQFFPAGPGFFSTFSLSTMVGGLRRSQALSPSASTVNCAGLSESLRTEIAATLGLSASVRETETDKVDLSYAQSCASIFENLLLSLRREMRAFLALRFEEFASSSHDYAALAAFILCAREGAGVAQYARKMDFLHGTVRQQHILHWADARTRGIAFVTYDHDVSEREKAPQIAEEDLRVYRRRRESAACVLTPCADKLTESRTIVGLQMDLTLPDSTSSLSVDTLSHISHSLRIWTTRDRLLTTQRELLAHTQTTLKLSPRFSAKTTATMTAAVGELSGHSHSHTHSQTSSRSSSSDYGEDVKQLGLSFSFSFDEHALSMRRVKNEHRSHDCSDDGVSEHDIGHNIDDDDDNNNNNNTDQDSDALILNALAAKTVLVELSREKTDSVLMSCSDNTTLTGTVFELLRLSTCAVDNLRREDHVFLSFQADSPVVKTLFETLFGETEKTSSCFSVHMSIRSERVKGKGCSAVELSFSIERTTSTSSFSTSFARDVISATRTEQSAASSFSSSSPVPPALHVCDITASLWHEVLCGQLIDSERASQQMFFDFQTRETLYDIYWQSFPLSEEERLFLCVSSSPSLFFDRESLLFKECADEAIAAWPIARRRGVVDFSLCELLVRRVGVREALQIVSLLLTNESLLIVSTHRETLSHLREALPRWVHPYETSHDVCMCVCDEELRRALKMRTGREQSRKEEREKNVQGEGPTLLFACADAYQRVREAVVSGRLHSEREREIFTIDLDQGTAHPIFSEGDDSQYSLLDLRNRSLFVENKGECEQDSALQRLVDRVHKIDRLLQSDLRSLSAHCDKSSLQHKVRLSALLLLSNAAVDNAFQRLHTELLLWTLPACVRHFPACSAVGCDVHRLLAALLGERERHTHTATQSQTESECMREKGGGTNTHTHSKRVRLTEREIASLPFDEFLAFYNDKTSSSAAVGSFALAFYASFLAALSPAFVDLLKRHGRIIEEHAF